jgi:hypothetical protein
MYERLLWVGSDRLGDLDMAGPASATAARFQSPPCVDIAAAAVRTDEPVAPLGNRGLGAVSAISAGSGST